MARNIIFIKTHKCASTTIQNSLVAYTRSYGGKILSPHRLGRNDATYAEQPLKFKILTALKAPFNLNMNHSPYEPYLHKLIPDAFCITSVREPLKRAVSHYYSFLHSSAPLPHHTFEMDFNEYYPSGFGNGELSVDRVKLGMDNYMSKWLGYRSEDEISEEALRERFHFIGLGEDMAKTNAIISKLLGTETNAPPARRNVVTAYTKFEVSDQVKNQFIKRNAMDYKLYTICKKIFSSYSPDQFETLRE